jgi:hypothetical protein
MADRSPVGSNGAWRASGAGGDPFDRRDQLRGIGRIADLDVVIEDDPVGVVHDLGRVAELHRLAQTSLAHRTSIDIMQADQPVARRGHHAGQPATGLRHHALGASHEGVEIVDRPM